MTKLRIKTQLRSGSPEVSHHGTETSETKRIQIRRSLINRLTLIQTINTFADIGNIAAIETNQWILQSTLINTNPKQTLKIQSLQ